MEPKCESIYCALFVLFSQIKPVRLPGCNISNPELHNLSEKQRESELTISLVFPGRMKCTAVDRNHDQ